MTRKIPRHHYFHVHFMHMKTQTAADCGKDASMKKTESSPVKKTKTAKVSFANPVLQRTYDALQKSIRDTKKMTREEAREWMKRICA